MECGRWRGVESSLPALGCGRHPKTLLHSPKWYAALCGEEHDVMVGDKWVVTGCVLGGV